MSEVHEDWQECGAWLDDDLNARWPILARILREMIEACRDWSALTGWEYKDEEDL